MSLFILPFDHRATFARDLLKSEYPPSKKVAKQVSMLKGMIFDGFLRVRKVAPHPVELSLLVDEEFGSAIIAKANKLKIAHAVSVEQSGQAVFTFEYGKKFGAHLKKTKATYAKVLVRYVIGDDVNNQVQNTRLKELSDYCAKQKIGLMLEILAEGKISKVAQVEIAMKQMIAAGIEPTIWKLEGMPKAADWKRLRKLTDQKIIVLGHGEGLKEVEHYVREAKKSGAVDGFAIGRTIFYQALADYLKQKKTKAEAITMVAQRYQYFIDLWQK